jgi:hypothetical protein
MFLPYEPAPQCQQTRSLASWMPGKLVVLGVAIVLWVVHMCRAARSVTAAPLV